MAVNKPRPKLANVTVSQEASTKELTKFYREMLLIRRFEERVGQMYGMGLIGGFLHLYVGQEAVVVGVENAITRSDPMITSYRCHGHMLARGEKPANVLAELTGSFDGVSKGKGGSMHMCSTEKNFFGGHGSVGAQVSIGTGLAFGQRYKGDNSLTLAYFGDGAANQGQVHESFNMAALWKLPVIYVIENNKYGMGTSVQRASAAEDLSQLGAGRGIYGVQVDGMDVEAVTNAGVMAAERCRNGEGPVILEMVTYRYRGHSMSDPANYRTKEEVSKIRNEQDPISNIKTRILGNKILSEDQIKIIDKEIREIVSGSADFAQSSPEPDPSELYTDVLVDT